jgi:hypothetical protein
MRRKLDGRVGNPGPLTFDVETGNIQTLREAPVALTTEGGATAG